MKQYTKPVLEVPELTANESLAGVVQSEPIVEDNEDLSA